MKKQILAVTLLLLGIAFTNQILAQQVPVDAVEKAVKADGKYAILVQNPMHLMASVMTGQEYKAKNKAVQFEIVLIGEVVKDMAESKQLEATIRKAENSGIRLVVCEFAMNKLGIKKSQYDTSIHTTPNGFTYLFGLQELGFKTITL
ncbi:MULTISPECIES: DsrE family protein [Sphingobacterium]|uniref:DsrE family protein n=1 Tax=Sphingobacterium TaxID=28453 RepID=UPI0013D93513|nr:MULTISPECIES: DsrE family protein [unclassified Sphingobacterium]